MTTLLRMRSDRLSMICLMRHLKTMVSLAPSQTLPRKRIYQRLLFHAFAGEFDRAGNKRGQTLLLGCEIISPMLRVMRRPEALFWQCEKKLLKPQVQARKSWIEMVSRRVSVKPPKFGLSDGRGLQADARRARVVGWSYCANL